MGAYLAFDFGAESGRAILGELSNDKLTLTERHRFANPTTRINGRTYWNLPSQFEEIKTGLKKVGSTPLAGIGVDTWGVDFGLVSKSGAVLSLPSHYRNFFTSSAMTDTHKTLGEETVYAKTGIQTLPFNTLYQLFEMKQRAPELLSCAQSILWMPDLFHYLLTGVRKAERSIASTGTLLDAASGNYAADLLERIGVSPSLLPDLIDPGTRLGDLSPDIVQECGCSSAPVIAPAGHDTGSAVAAVPASAGNWCYISSGTWSLMGVESPTPITTPQAKAAGFTNEAGVNRSIRFLKNIAGLWLVQECRRHWVSRGQDLSYAELTTMASNAKRFAVIDPGRSEFALPGEMPAKIEAFCKSTGQDLPATPGEFILTCLATLALTYRRTLESLEKLLGKKIDTVHIVGGGTQNKLLNQLTADACNRRVIAGPVEATAIGNLLFQAMATKEVRDLSHLRQIVRNSFPVETYNPADVSRWEMPYRKLIEVSA